MALQTQPPPCCCHCPGTQAVAPDGTATYRPLSQVHGLVLMPVYRQWPGCQIVGAELGGGGGTSSETGGGGGIGTDGTIVLGDGSTITWVVAGGGELTQAVSPNISSEIKGKT